MIWIYTKQSRHAKSIITNYLTLLIIVFLFQINNLFAQVGVAARKGCGRRWSVWFEWPSENRIGRKEQSWFKFICFRFIVFITNTSCCAVVSCWQYINLKGNSPRSWDLSILMRLIAESKWRLLAATSPGTKLLSMWPVFRCLCCLQSSCPRSRSWPRSWKSWPRPCPC